MDSINYTPLHQRAGEAECEVLHRKEKTANGIIKQWQTFTREF